MIDFQMIRNNIWSLFLTTKNCLKYIEKLIQNEYMRFCHKKTFFANYGPISPR